MLCRLRYQRVPQMADRIRGLACTALLGLAQDVEVAQDPFFQNYEGQSKWVVPDDRGCNCVIS